MSDHVCKYNLSSHVEFTEISIHHRKNVCHHPTVRGFLQEAPLPTPWAPLPCFFHTTSHFRCQHPHGFLSKKIDLPFKLMLKEYLKESQLNIIELWKPKNQQKLRNENHIWLSSTQPPCSFVWKIVIPAAHLLIAIRTTKLKTRHKSLQHSAKFFNYI